MTTRLLITGLGTITPHGMGPAPLAAGLAEGRSANGAIDRSGGFHREESARMVGHIDPADLGPWIDPKLARRMSLPSRMAVAAARMAVEDAGLAGVDIARADVPVCMGTAFGPDAFTVKLLDQIRRTGPESASPFLFMESVANAHAGQVALDAELGGPNATVVQREASGLLAVAQGATYLRSGRSSIALVGVVDELASMTHSVLDRLGGLSRGTPGFGEQGRPFDVDRDGFVASQGATVLVLEREEHARARGAPVRGRLHAVIRGNDPTASVTNWGRDPEHLARVARRGLDRAGIDLASVDRIVSGASGARLGDRLEALHLRELFGRRELPAILAPKACTGEYGGGFLAAAVLALSESPWPTPGFERVDPELGVRPHDGRDLSAPRCALVSCQSSGGAAAWLLLGRA